MGYTAGAPINLGGGSSGFAGFTAVAISADTVLTAASHNNHALEVTTGATDKLLTLPTTGNNDGDEMIVIKTDSAAGRIVFASLAGAANLPWLTDQDDWIRLHYSV